LPQRAQLGQLRFLSPRRVGIGMVANPGQHLALSNALPGHRQASRTGFDATTMHGLHPTTGVWISDHPPGEFDRGGRLGQLRERGAHAHPSLGGLGQIDASVRQARQALSIDGRRPSLEVLAVRTVGAGSGPGFAGRHEPEGQKERQARGGPAAAAAA